MQHGYRHNRGKIPVVLISLLCPHVFIPEFYSFVGFFWFTFFKNHFQKEKHVRIARSDLSLEIVATPDSSVRVKGDITLSAVSSDALNDPTKRYKWKCSEYFFYNRYGKYSEWTNESLSSVKDMKRLHSVFPPILFSFTGHPNVRRVLVGPNFFFMALSSGKQELKQIFFLLSYRSVSCSY